jgi:hypothetical protein
MKSQPAGMLLSEDLLLPKNWHHVLLVELLDWFSCFCGRPVNSFLTWCNLEAAGIPEAPVWCLEFLQQ